MKQIKYSGQIIEGNGRISDQKRAEAFKNIPSPNDVTYLQTFLGLANYHSIYITKMYNFKALLNDLLKKGRKWIRSKGCEVAFQKIKKKNCYQIIVSSLWPEKEIIVACNWASNDGMGAIILYKFKDRTTKPMRQELYILQIVTTMSRPLKEEVLSKLLALEEVL